MKYTGVIADVIDRARDFDIKHGHPPDTVHMTQHELDCAKVECGVSDCWWPGNPFAAEPITLFGMTVHMTDTPGLHVSSHRLERHERAPFTRSLIGVSPGGVAATEQR